MRRYIAGVATGLVLMAFMPINKAQHSGYPKPAYASAAQVTGGRPPNTDMVSRVINTWATQCAFLTSFAMANWVLSLCSDSLRRSTMLSKRHCENALELRRLPRVEWPGNTKGRVSACFVTLIPRDMRD